MPTRREVLKRVVWGVQVAGLFGAGALSGLAQQSDQGLPKASASSKTRVLIGARPGDERDDNGLKMKLAWCPPGSYAMGTPKSANVGENEHQVEVTLSNGFWLGKYEVTQEEWEHVAGTAPWKGRKYVQEGPRYAATYLSWNDAREFVTKLTGQERAAGRLPKEWEYALPTEAQWEYACRAGTKTFFGFGAPSDSLSEFAWWGGLQGFGNAANEQYAHEVGRKKPNAWGLHDMHGNVWEWCQDGYETKVPGGVDPLVEQGSRRTIRGGGWLNDPFSCRSARRYAGAPGDQVFSAGFRVALRLAR